MENKKKTFYRYNKISMIMECAILYLTNLIDYNFSKGELIKIGTSKELIKETKTKNFEDAFVKIAGGEELC